ncbi:MAG: hypothetical protein ABH873_01695 [Candidatus Firestonebacteria bacterium]
MTNGVTALNSVHTEAQTYLNHWYDYFKKTPGTDDDWAWNPRTEHSDWVWDDAFARYGPASNPNVSRTIYDHNGNRTCIDHPAGCIYTTAVRGIINNPPW